jgi:AbrB family looped-hinge helix DNA binding protein
MTAAIARVDSRGRVTIPAALRQALGLNPGTAAVLIPDGPALRVVSRSEQIRRAQQLVRRYVPAGRSLSQELLAQRRREADRPRSPA